MKTVYAILSREELETILDTMGAHKGATVSLNWEVSTDATLRVDGASQLTKLKATPLSSRPPILPGTLQGYGIKLVQRKNFYYRPDKRGFPKQCGKLDSAVFPSAGAAARWAAESGLHPDHVIPVDIHV